MDERERVLLTLAGVRVFMGVFWLVNLLWRLPTDFGGGNYWGLPRIFEVARTHAISPARAQLVGHVLVPHMTTVGWIVFVAGLLTGVSLVFGLLTSLARRSASCRRSRSRCSSATPPGSGSTAT